MKNTLFLLIILAVLVISVRATIAYYKDYRSYSVQKYFIPGMLDRKLDHLIRAIACTIMLILLLITFLYSL